MATVAEKLNKLLQIKENIRQAITNKGIEVSEDTVFDDYASKIDSIESGSSSEETYECPDFYELRTNGGTDYSYLFSNYSGAYSQGDTLDLSNWDTSKVTGMSYTFKNLSGFTSINLTGWNTSNVTFMSNMFYSCYSLTTLNLNNFNTSKVTNMYNMFSWCNKLTSLDLSNFNTSNVTDMYGMFDSCSKLTTVNLSNFDMTNVTKSDSMFRNCTALHTIRLDNCSNDTINKVVTSSNFPTDAITDITRKIYINPDNKGDLTAPSPWVFVNKDTEEIIS